MRYVQNLLVPMSVFASSSCMGQNWVIYRQNWSFSPHDKAMQPFVPSTAHTRYHKSKKTKNKCHLIKKGQEGWQLDYPSSNHLRCNTMWPPSPSLRHWNPSYAYELVLVGLVFATSQTTGRTITSFQDRDKFWVHLWDNNKELLVN